MTSLIMRCNQKCHVRAAALRSPEREADVLARQSGAGHESQLPDKGQHTVCLSFYHAGCGTGHA